MAVTHETGVPTAPTVVTASVPEPSPAPEPSLSPVPAPEPATSADHQANSGSLVTDNSVVPHDAATAPVSEVDGDRLNHAVTEAGASKLGFADEGLATDAQVKSLMSDGLDRHAPVSSEGTAITQAIVAGAELANSHADGGVVNGLAGSAHYPASNELFNAESLFAQAGQLQAQDSLESMDTQWGGSADHGAGWTSSTLEVDLTSAPSDPSTQGGWTVYVDHQPYVPTAHEQQLGAIHLDGPAHVSIVLFDASGAPQSLSADHVDTITWGAGGHIG